MLTLEISIGVELLRRLEAEIEDEVNIRMGAIQNDHDEKIAMMKEKLLKAVATHASDMKQMHEKDIATQALSRKLHVATATLEHERLVQRKRVHSEGWKEAIVGAALGGVAAVITIAMVCKNGEEAE